LPKRKFPDAYQLDDELALEYYHQQKVEEEAITLEKVPMPPQAVLPKLVWYTARKKKPLAADH